MRITVIAMIKNAADIIETFIRGNAQVADNFVILDNLSTDNTIVILEKLIEEGFQIELLKDPANAYEQDKRMNMLLRYVNNKYDPDFILPLDDDEIIFSTLKDVDARSAIAKLEKDKLYFATWRNYIPAEDDDPEDLCVPRRLRYCFHENMASYSKVIIPNQIAKNESFALAMGNHDMIGEGIVRVQLSNLRIAHFPCRSRAQIISKALVGWTNFLANPMKKPGDAVHWKRIYDLVRDREELSIEDLWSICMMYLHPFNAHDLSIVKDPLDISEDCFVMRYTIKDEIDPLMNYMLNTEHLAEEYCEMRKKLSGQGGDSYSGQDDQK